MTQGSKWLACAALVACAHAAPANQPADAYPEAYAGPPPDPLEDATALVHRNLDRARKSMETIQLACLRDKESKLEALRAERERMPREEVDARARALRADVEHCVGGG